MIGERGLLEGGSEGEGGQIEANEMVSLKMPR